MLRVARALVCSACSPTCAEFSPLTAPCNCSSCRRSNCSCLRVALTWLSRLLATLVISCASRACNMRSWPRTATSSGFPVPCAVASCASCPAAVATCAISPPISGETRTAGSVFAGISPRSTRSACVSCASFSARSRDTSASWRLVASNCRRLTVAVRDWALSSGGLLVQQVLLAVVFDIQVGETQLLAERGQLILEPFMCALHSGEFFLPLEVQELPDDCIGNEGAQLGVARGDGEP